MFSTLQAIFAPSVEIRIKVRLPADATPSTFVATLQRLQSMVVGMFAERSNLHNTSEF